jgi:hypothetical protein
LDPLETKNQSAFGVTLAGPRPSPATCGIPEPALTSFGPPVGSRGTCLTKDWQRPWSFSADASQLMIASPD